MNSRQLWTVWVAAAFGGTVVHAQAPPAAPEPADTVFVMRDVAPLPAIGGQIDIIRHEADVLGAVVKDKPYSAKSTTESVQTLADGNRIINRNESTIYRDSEGRTRREQTLGSVGPWQAGEPVTLINVRDPVADKSFVLDPVARTARELRPFRMAFAQAQEVGQGAGVGVRATWTAAVPPPPGLPPPAGATSGSVAVTQATNDEQGVRVFTRGVAAAFPATFSAALGASQASEDLGEQVLEGLLVQGTRLTSTIPVGAMGNERPIEVVTERWYSQDIEATVLERFVDPRFGETTYRLVNVVRGDPSPDLFQVPQGYEVVVDEGPQLRGFPGTPGQRVGFELKRLENGTPPPP